MQSTASRVLLRQSRPSPNLVQQPKRLFQQYGTKSGYKTGFERMISDKTRWAGVSGMGGLAFALWGVLNAGVYGLSFVMQKENWEYHFVYTGSGKFLQPFKSMMASNDYRNVGWTAPSLILGGLLLQQKVGSMSTLKLFGMCLTASYLATTAMGPCSFNSHLNIRPLWPASLRFDCIDLERQRMCGADLMAGMCLYSVCFAYGLWPLGAACAVFDASYYGPMGLAMPTTAAVAALTLL